MAKPKKKVLTKAEQKAKEREKRERLARVEVETKRKQLHSAGVQWDPRTAQGKRDFHVASLGGAVRASINHFNSCFRKKSERTNARILAWSKFDEHSHRVHAGEIAPPKLEPGVDVSKTPGVADSRLDALREDARLRAWLGVELHGLMEQVIYHQRSYNEIRFPGLPEARGDIIIGVMFKRALDLAAAFWHLGEDDKKGADMSRALWKTELQEGA